jgi:PAS domain S-box-containing protein
LHFRQAIEHSLGTGIVVVDENGKCLLVNPAFCKMTGWPAEELTGQPAPYCYWPEEERPAIREAFERTLRGEAAPDGMELRFCRKNGTRFDVLIKVAPLLDNEDRPLGWLGAVADITSIQHIRRDLLATNERLRIAQDVAEFGIWDWDPAKDTLHWDRKSFALFGHPEATDAQAVWRQVHSEAEQERLTGELNRLITAGGSRGQDLIHARWPDGTRHDIASNYVILRDQSGRATRVLGLNHDVTGEPEKARDWRSRLGRGE